MTEHLSPSFLEQFRDRSLSAASLARAALHLEECPDCHRNWRESGRGQRSRAPDEPVTLLGRRDWGDLAWLADEHPAGSVVARYVQCLRQGRLQGEELEMLELHLRQCPACRERIRLARSAGVTPVVTGWRPKIATILTFLLIGGMVSLLTNEIQRSSRQTADPADPGLQDHRQTRHSTVSQQVAPVGPPIRSATSTPVTGVRPGLGSHGAGGRPGRRLPLVIEDGGRRIELDINGRLTGLEELTPTERGWITGVLQREELPDSRVMRLQLAESPRLRAPLAGQSEETAIRLLAPLPEVLVDTRPVLVWAPQADAAIYQIELREIGGRQILLSPELEGEIDQWQLPAPLRRGSAWRAVLRIRPAADPLTWRLSRPRLFSILGERELRELDSLRSRTSSHLARGLIFARWGLISEARREIEMLEEQNRESLLIKRFLLNLLAESYDLN